MAGFHDDVEAIRMTFDKGKAMWKHRDTLHCFLSISKLTIGNDNWSTFLVRQILLESVYIVHRIWRSQTTT